MIGLSSPGLVGCAQQKFGAKRSSFIWQIYQLFYPTPIKIIVEARENEFHSSALDGDDSISNESLRISSDKVVYRKIMTGLFGQNSKATYNSTDSQTNPGQT
ncbi:hypothetical protein HAX54_004143 [Datura stramonium]|uniref:Uncharacterized protein n=1 Tax=Datura stramonium TaxID=4076 RepID=A0ABS8WVA2_DATST|nr:hypothetical protein [Datura stramonium]